MFGFRRSSHLSFRRLFGQNNVPQMFTGASKLSQHPGWDAEGGQCGICLLLGGPRTENQTLTSTAACSPWTEALPVRGRSMLPTLGQSSSSTQNQRRGFLHITLHLCFWLCPFLILALVFNFYFLRGHCYVNKERGGGVIRSLSLSLLLFLFGCFLSIIF